MKALVAATCVALLGAVGYVFYGEYAEAQSRAESEATRVAKANCIRILDDAEKGITEGLADKLTGCLLIGALTQGDLDRAVSRANERR